MTTTSKLSSPFAMDYRCTDSGDWFVLQGHADYCQNYGHATYVVNGEDRGHCPRCGTAYVTGKPQTDR